MLVMDGLLRLPLHRSHSFFVIYCLMQFKGKGGKCQPHTLSFCLLAAAHAHVSLCPAGFPQPALTGTPGPGPLLTVFAGKAPRGPGHGWCVTSQSLFPISSRLDESITSANTPSTNHKCPAAHMPTDTQQAKLSSSRSKHRTTWRCPSRPFSGLSRPPHYSTCTTAAKGLFGIVPVLPLPHAAAMA